MEKFKGQKIPQIHVNEHLVDICFHKSIQDSLLWNVVDDPKTYNRNLEPFFRTRDLMLQVLRREVFDMMTMDREYGCPEN